MNYLTKRAGNVRAYSTLRFIHSLPFPFISFIINSKPANNGNVCEFIIGYVFPDHYLKTIIHHKKSNYVKF